MRRKTVIVAGLLVLTIGCAVTAAAAAVSKPPQHLTKADGRLAGRLVVHLNDLPAGWHAETFSGSSGGKCATPHNFPKGVVLTGKAQSSFANGETDLAISFGVVLSTVSGSKATFALLRGFLRGCLLTAGRHVAKDARVDAMSFPHVGNESAAWEMSATISGTEIYFHAVMARVRRAIAFYVFGGLAPADLREEVRVVRRAMARA